MKATIVTIGDEILIGQITDTNSAWLAAQLSALGIVVDRIYSIPDTVTEIMHTLELIQNKTDLVILTGGLGPTKDDVTKTALCKFMNCGMVFNEELYTSIKQYFNKLGLPLTSAIKDQCHLPEAAEILENKMGTAPGMLFKKNDQMILSLPGVPYEMVWIWENSFNAILDIQNDYRHQFQHITIRTVGIGESSLEEKIRDIIDAFPPELTIAYLPSLGQVRLRLTLRSLVKDNDVLEKFRLKIVDRLGNLVYGYENVSLEESVQNIFIQKNLSLSTAESCTGGHLAHSITSIPGSSAYYHGSIVAYNNRIKENVLNVNPETLKKYGAVSEETVIEMLKGLFIVLKTDVGVSISGVAGPGGGSPDKPVGTVWLAWGTKDNMFAEKLSLGKNRSKNIEYSSIAALNRLRLFLST